MNASVIRYASRSKALRDLNAWVELRTPIPPGSVAERLVRERELSGEDSCISQDVWFRDWPKGYDLIEIAKHHPAFEETFSLLWFAADTGPDEPVKARNGAVRQDDDGGLQELDGVLKFKRK